MQIISSSHLSAYIYVVVIIRFSPQSYIVAEDDESVNVTLQLVGEATRPLSVLVNSIGISSTGIIITVIKKAMNKYAP